MVYNNSAYLNCSRINRTFGLLWLLFNELLTDLSILDSQFSNLNVAKGYSSFIRVNRGKQQVGRETALESEWN